MRWLIMMLFLVGCDCVQEEEWEVMAAEDWEAIQFGGDGAMSWEGDVLHLDLGVELTGGRYDGELPEVPYVLEFEARKLNGTDFFCGVTFPVGSAEECLTLILGGWGGGTVGISSIDGKDASENETTSYRNFEKDRWYGVRLEVREERISAWLDGEEIVDFETEGRVLGLRPGVIELCAPFGVAAWQTEAEYRGLEWRSLGH